MPYSFVITATFTKNDIGMVNSFDTSLYFYKTNDHFPKVNSPLNYTSYRSNTNKDIMEIRPL